MDVTEQMNLFHKFIETDYYKDLLRQVSKGEKYLKVNFNLLSKFNPELAELLLEKPEEIIKAAELTVESFDIDGDTQNFKIRFFNLPESQKAQIRNIRSKHIGKLIELEGLVRQKSDVRPQVTSARFECPSCGNIIAVLQLDTKFKEPSRCSCGRRGKFRLISKELVDAQKLVLEEAPEDLGGGEQPKRLNIFLKSDLVSPMSDKKTNPGNKINVVGIIKEVPIEIAGIRTTRFDLFSDANNVEPIQEDFYDLDISEEEEQEILELSKDKRIFEKLTESLAPSIYGHEKVKEAILLQMLGGVIKKRDRGDITRGDIHILLIGDPGSGKSQLLKRVSVIAPKSRYVSGKGATGAGLTATVVKDEFLRGWALEAGALVLTNKGICCIDELDKMTPEDQSAMHEALEQQTISISKANIQATLKAETTVLAAANPKFGRFDPYEMIAKQIELPTTLINRFDLIFPFRDLPNKEKDEKMANFILRLHQTSEKQETVISSELLKKYVSYARRKIFPKLTDVALNEIKDFFVTMRNMDSGDSGIKTIPISARQLEALIRLSEASAKVELREKVTKKDARRAIDIIHYCLSQIGMDPDTGKIDIDRLVTGISASQRNEIVIVREVINELEKVLGKTIPLEDVEREAEIRGVDKNKLNDVIEKLKRSGDIFSPKHGVISRI
ncbi:MAG: minichromosome maintenance protein MCM [Nanoarchaeota archaeon]|nr:minichromosome maintenance protein MCM [Nanoarchaeota archaeon]MBU1322409.1 minichromosome maintenance protein MCM [Nanoarchaeota archaeon]MBU1598221.1 minichromosome maintenance protein MCM [Nanoarchaeota archaeon]MBU2441077.1 minichromosome maintenance protein MCM [Nanoarchaeota archaeon]